MPVLLRPSWLVFSSFNHILVGLAIQCGQHVGYATFSGQLYLSYALHLCDNLPFLYGLFINM
jgi:hypothetical protein